VTRSCAFGPLIVSYDEYVLTPRPWTLEQSRWAADLAADAPPGPILELCAGAGHIGLAAAVLADRDLVQVEADPVAVRYAEDNAERAGWSRRTEVRTARLETALAPDERFALIVADPPYLRSSDVARWPEDPQAAIDGGADGLDVIRQCIAVATEHLTADGQLLLQVAGPAQDARVRDLLAAAPTVSLVPRDTRVVDDERAILLIGRPAHWQQLADGFSPRR
jgi:methylase of polypeptide subunit release factors